MPEQWRAVVGFEGFYEVSDHGRVRSVDRVLPMPTRYGPTTRKHKGKFLSLRLSHDGYVLVGLRRAGKLHGVNVHRLVALAFIPNPQTQVGHKDGCRTNNHVGNLEWTTPKENTAHALAMGSFDSALNPRMSKRLTITQVREIRRHHTAGATPKQLSLMFGVHKRTIYKITSKEIWRTA